MALELLKEDDSDELLNEELVLPWQTNLAEKTRAASCVYSGLDNPVRLKTFFLISDDPGIQVQRSGEKVFSTSGRALSPTI